MNIKTKTSLVCWAISVIVMLIVISVFNLTSIWSMVAGVTTAAVGLTVAEIINYNRK